MSDQVSWQENNARYLSLALAWLRLRLERHAQQWQSSEILPPAPEPAPAPQPQKQGFLKRTPPEPARPAVIALPQAATSITDEQIAQKASEMADAESHGDAPPGLVILSKQLGLSRFEQEVLLLCIAMELDTRIATLCARAQDDASRLYPTFALALALYDNPSWDVLSPERPLRYWRLIEINQPAAQPLTTSPLRADERVVNYVKGLNYLDDRLASLIVPLSIDTEHTRLPQSQESLVKTIVRHWQRAESSLQLIQLIGPDPLSK